MRVSILITSFIILIFPSLLFSQKPPIKFGKISKTEKEISKTDLDSDANAIILCDFGEINFLGSSVDITRHTRIKILNQNGLDEANIVLPFYSKNNNEKIFKVKAHTINIGKNGKEEKVKVKKSEIYTVDGHKDSKEIRFTFSSVKPGSIIEFQYSKKSKNSFSLEEWNFQNRLPTLKSQLNVLVGINLDYKILYNGNRLISKYGSDNVNSWTLENLPPLKEEVYCPNPEDYIESVRFQLAGYKKHTNLPGGGFETVKIMTTWEKSAEQILDSSPFKSVLKKRKEAKKLVQLIVNEEDDDLEKVKKIYSYVQTNIFWNGLYRQFPEENFSKIIKTKRGSSAEINLILVLLLQSANLDANPLIISTKGNGLISKSYPIINQFNHILAQVKINGEDILMDAISKFRPYNLLSKNDLNPNGYLVSKTEPRWIEIKYPTKSKTVIVNNLSFTDSHMEFKTSYSFFEHEAVKYRSKYHNEEGNESFITKHLQNQIDGEEIILDSFKVVNPNDLNKPFAITCYYSKELNDGLNVDLIYLNPFIKKHLEKNPFIDPIRYLPVDFISPTTERFILNLQLPEGFELAEIPISTKYSTESNKVSYTYAFSRITEKKVQLTSNYKIINPLILPEEYPALRELYNRMMGMQSNQLVLKRK